MFIFEHTSFKRVAHGNNEKKGEGVDDLKLNTRTTTRDCPDTHYRVLDLIHKDPSITQRALAQRTGISLGAMNYCMKALISKGWVKAGNFASNPDKSIYLYLLTPKGVMQKSKLALDFLKRKKQEYDALKREIERISREVEGEM
jgi:EPS-associated MarR family transcriptional regulator